MNKQKKKRLNKINVEKFIIGRQDFLVMHFLFLQPKK